VSIQTKIILVGYCLNKKNIKYFIIKVYVLLIRYFIALGPMLLEMRCYNCITIIFLLIMCG